MKKCFPRDFIHNQSIQGKGVFIGGGGILPRPLVAGRGTCFFRTRGAQALSRWLSLVFVFPKRRRYSSFRWWKAPTGSG